MEETFNCYLRVSRNKRRTRKNILASCSEGGEYSSLAEPYTRSFLLSPLFCFKFDAANYSTDRKARKDGCFAKFDQSAQIALDAGAVLHVHNIHINVHIYIHTREKEAEVQSVYSIGNAISSALARVRKLVDLRAREQYCFALVLCQSLLSTQRKPAPSLLAGVKLWLALRCHGALGAAKSSVREQRDKRPAPAPNTAPRSFFEASENTRARQKQIWALGATPKAD